MEQKYLALHIASQEPVMESQVLTHLQNEFYLEARITVHPSEDAEARNIAAMVKPLLSADYVTFLVFDLFLSKAEIDSLNISRGDAGRIIWTPKKDELYERFGYYETADPEGKIQIHFGPDCLKSYQIYRHLVDVRHKPKNQLVVFNIGKIKLPYRDLVSLCHYTFKGCHVDHIYAEDKEASQYLRGVMRLKLENLIKQGA